MFESFVLKSCVAFLTVGFFLVKYSLFVEVIDYLLFAIFLKYNYLLGIGIGLVISIILSSLLYKHKKENISYLLICTLIELLPLIVFTNKLLVKTIINPLVIIIYHLLVSKKIEISL